MGSCMAKEKEKAPPEPIVVVKKQKKVPSLSNIEENHLYKSHIERSEGTSAGSKTNLAVK